MKDEGLTGAFGGLMLLLMVIMKLYCENIYDIMVFGYLITAALD